jgi:hypothetical protein
VTRPAAPEPRPGFALFVTAFFASPLILVVWAAGQWVLRVTGWPRWRVGSAAAVSGALVIWAQGGVVPAFSSHFSGYLGLLSQFGRPMVHLPTPGAFLWPQIALSVPVGLLAASLTRRTDLAVPDPAAATRAARREQRDRRQARRLVGRVRSSETNRQTNNALGVSLGGDLDAWRSGRFVVLPDYAARLPRLVLGRPGQGKSVYLCREMFLAGFAARQGIILDGKGDSEFAAAVVDAYLAGWQAAGHPGTPSIHSFPDEPLSVWAGSPAEQVNKLLGCWAWSIEAAYYREVCVLALRLACGQPGPPVASMGDLIARLDPAQLAKAWHGHPAEAGLVKTLRDKLGDVQLRLANLGAAAAGLLDGQRALGDSDLCVVSLPALANRGDSEAVFRIVLADLGHWTASRKGHRPGLAMVDEFGSLDGGRDYAVDLFERGRGAGVPVVLSGQSYRSLGDEDTRDRLISSADALVLFGSATPDEGVRLAGTVLEAEAVYATEDGVWSGKASVTHRHRAKVDANSVRQLGVGEAIVISRGRAARMLVIPAPKGLPAPPIAGTLHPSTPGRAVASREVPPPDQPRQGASPALRRPSGDLDGPARSPVRRYRPPGSGGEAAPPVDRAGLALEGSEEVMPDDRP